MARLLRTLTLAWVAAALRVSPTQKDVDTERVKLGKMSTMLSSMLSNKALSNSKVAPSLKLFASNLDTILNMTKTMKPVDAMKKLSDARAGVKGLLSDMTKTQESLMKDDFQSRESLLMGVLMTHQKDAIDAQKNILQADEFKGLDVSKALLQSNDTAKPLYVQAATYLDSHKNAGGEMAHTSASHAAHAEALAASLERRVSTLVTELNTKQSHHAKKMAELQALVSKGGKEVNILKATIKREEHRFKKWAALQQHDIDTMKTAADAVRKGDVKALDRARSALQASLNSLKDKNGGMMVFLQQGNTLFEQDCPYCAAQCVEKCHNKGEPYTACLGECADAGK